MAEIIQARKIGNRGRKKSLPPPLCVAHLSTHRAQQALTIVLVEPHEEEFILLVRAEAHARHPRERLGAPLPPLLVLAFFSSSTLVGVSTPSLKARFAGQGLGPPAIDPSREASRLLYSPSSLVPALSCPALHNRCARDGNLLYVACPRARLCVMLQQIYIS